MSRPTPGASAALCTASASYKKQPGVLSLSNRALTWSAGTGGGVTSGGDLNIASSRMSALFSSKEGGAKVMLRVSVYPISATVPQADENHSFTFTAASSAISDREHFKAQLSIIISLNRNRKEQQASAPASPGGTSTPGSGADRALGSIKGKERAIPSQAALSFELRKAVLTSDPDLAALHRELVLGGLISELEFWEGREDLLAEVQAEKAQQHGKSGKMVDPKPEQGEGLDYTVKITPQLMQEIFEEYPNVLRAFDENVPEPLDVHEFWTRYFQSKLFNRNRTTNRAAVNTVKDDAIFDLYLGEEDDDIEPKNLKTQEIYRLLDLAATEDDQHEVTNQADLTMRAGGERASLPLMRRFNEHSERLLNQSLGLQASQNRMALDPGNAGGRNYYADIVLDDLNDSLKSDRIVLDMAKALPAVDQGQQEKEGEMDQEEKERILSEMKGDFEGWEPSLGEFHTNNGAMVDAVEDMMVSIRYKSDRHHRDSSKTGNIPPSLLSTLLSLSTSSNEFLRQFWSAVLPPKLGDLSAAALATSEMKAAKAERMKVCLDKAMGRIEGVLSDVRGMGDEGLLARVMGAIQPVKDAVENALTFYTMRTGK